MSASPTQTSLLKKHSVKLVGSVIIAFALWLILRRGGLPVFPATETFEKVHGWTVAAYAVTVGLWSFVRAMRTRHLLLPVASVSNRQILTVSWIGFLSIFVLPFRIGEMVRPALFHHQGQVSFATATGACGAERIIDGLVLMTLLGISLPLGGPLDPLPDHIGKLPIPVVAVPAAAYSMLMMFIAAFTAMALFYWRRGWARQMTDRVFGLVSKRLASFLAGQVEKISEGFRFLPSPRHLLPYLLETLLYWGIAAMGMWLLAWGCGVQDMTYIRSCALLGVLGLGIIVPGAPGYFGAFQGSVYAGLALYFSENVVLGAGSAYVFLLYTTQLGMMFLLAAVAGLLDRDSMLVATRGKLTSEHEPSA